MQTDPSSLRPKRRIRNYLLDPKFQLRYAALLAGSAGALLMLLGAVVASTSTMAINEARASTDLATLAVEQAARAVAEGEASARVLRLHQLSLSEPDSAAARAIEAALTRVDHSSRAELDRVRGLRARAVAQRARVEALRPRLLVWITASGIAFVLALGAIGIVITHRVVGPAWRMRRLLAKVGSGVLRVDERLRRGDELGSLFDAFVAMVDALRRAREDELLELDRAIARLEPDSPAMAALQALRRRVRARLSDVPPA